jgi:hypothetical protein
MHRIAILLVCLLSSEAQAGWFSYDNYEDCMLGRMKGQDPSMYLNADKLCKKEFGVAVWVNTSDVEWRFTANSIRLVKTPPEYEITTGEFQFSNKQPCEGLKPEDFSKPEIVKFSNGEAPIPEELLKGMYCVRTLSFQGKYK